MKIKTIHDIDLKGKTVLYRSPYDIGVKELSNGEYAIKDDSRIFRIRSWFAIMIDIVATVQGY